MLKGCSLNFVLSSDGTQITMPQSDVALMQQAGVQVARVDLHLGSVASWSDPHLLANYTTVINWLTAGGIQVLGLLGYGIVPNAQQSAWNAGAIEQGGIGTNPFIDAYASAVYDVVRAFPQVHLWECWNESDNYASQPSPGAYVGNSYLYPSLFAAVLNRAQPIIKQHNPSDTVITGGLLAQDLYNTNEDSSGATYLESVYQYGGWDTHSTPFDAVGLHLYLDQAGALNPVTLQRYIDQYLAVDVTNEGRTRWKSVWITEMGTDSSVVGTATQAANLAQLLAQLRQQPYVKAALNYQLRDTNQHFGLYNADGSPKPALAAFQSH